MLWASNSRICLIILGLLNESEAVFALRVDHPLQLLLQLPDPLVLQLPSDVVILYFVRVVLYYFELLLDVHLLLLDLHLSHQFVVLQGDDFLLKLIHLQLQTPEFLVLEMLLGALDLRLPGLDALVQRERPSFGRRHQMVLALLRALHFLKLELVHLKRQCLVGLLQFGNLLGFLLEAELSFLQLNGQRCYHAIQPLNLSVLLRCVSPAELTGDSRAWALFLSYVLRRRLTRLARRARLEERQRLVVQVQHSLNHCDNYVDALLIE